MSLENKYQLIHKKLTNQLSIEESAHLERISSQDEEMFNDIETIWNLSADFTPPVSFNADSAFDSLMSRIRLESVVEHESDIEASSSEAKVLKMFSIRTLSRIAAIFIVAICAYTSFNHVAYDKYSSSDSSSFASLEDGSSVWLAPGSSLTYSSMFGNTRKAILKGKAYFEIAKDESKPFVISSDDLEVSVLGTSFTVDSQSRFINVNSGTVKVAAPSGEITLTKGQAVDASRDKLSIDSSTEIDLKWINPTLKFDNTPLDQVIKELAIYFNVNLIYKGRTDLSTCPFTATDLSNASLDQVLTILSATYNMEIKKELNEDVESIYLSRVRCR